MSAVTIRRFRLAYEEYRHAIDTNTDEVFLQRQEDSGEWACLVRYDSDCCVWDMSVNPVGRFLNVDDHWVFIWNDGVQTVCEHTRGAESLLDSEVAISKHWLEQQS